ncbi:MAG: hypothetical protein WAU86_23345 [Oricola sp.]
MLTTVGGGVNVRRIFEETRMIFRPANGCSDRDLDCELAIETEFDAMIERAKEAGWTADEVTNALLSLAQARIEESRADAFVDIPRMPRRLSH